GGIARPRIAGRFTRFGVREHSCRRRPVRLRQKHAALYSRTARRTRRRFGRDRGHTSFALKRRRTCAPSKRVDWFYFPIPFFNGGLQRAGERHDPNATIGSNE